MLAHHELSCDHGRGDLPASLVRTGVQPPQPTAPRALHQNPATSPAHLNRLRLRAALGHVAEPRLALAEIAHDHGFSSQSHGPKWREARAFHDLLVAPAEKDLAGRGILCNHCRWLALAPAVSGSAYSSAAFVLVGHEW